MASVAEDCAASVGAIGPPDTLFDSSSGSFLMATPDLAAVFVEVVEACLVAVGLSTSSFTSSLKPPAVPDTAALVVPSFLNVLDLGVAGAANASAPLREALLLPAGEAVPASLRSFLKRCLMASTVGFFSSAAMTVSEGRHQIEVRRLTELVSDSFVVNGFKALLLPTPVKQLCRGC
jgi:hypothetical protein